MASMASVVHRCQVLSRVAVEPLLSRATLARTLPRVTVRTSCTAQPLPPGIRIFDPWARGPVTLLRSPAGAPRWFSSRSPNLYDVLGVSKMASADEIKRSYYA